MSHDVRANEGGHNFRFPVQIPLKMVQMVDFRVPYKMLFTELDCCVWIKSYLTIFGAKILGPLDHESLGETLTEYGS